VSHFSDSQFSVLPMDTISLPFGNLPLVLEMYSIPFNRQDHGYRSLFFPPKRLMLCFVVCDYQPNNRQTFMNHKQKFAHWCQQRQHLHLNQVVLPDGVGGYRWVSDMVSFLQSHVDAQVTMAIKCIILLPNCWRDIGVVERVCVGRSSACDGAAQNRASRRSSTFPGGGWRSCHQCEEICLFYLMGWVHLSVENFKVDRR